MQDEIIYEHVTDEITASYRDQGFSLVFAEEVMRYDLSLHVPDIAPSADISYLTWNEASIPSFFSVYQAAFRDRPGFPEWDQTKWVRWTSGDPSFRADASFIALAEGEAVGFVTCAEDEAAPERNGYLIQVGVSPDWRRQRIAAALVSRSLRVWQEEKKESVMLHVNINNIESMHLCLQLGFMIVGRRGKFRRSITSDSEQRS